MENINAVVKGGSSQNFLKVDTAAIQRAEIEMAVSTAKAYPRDIVKFKDVLMERATADIATAQDCVYALPRGGTTIYGSSIRLAEIAMTSYGNLIVEGAIIGDDGEWVYTVGQARDIETNIAVRRAVRRRLTKRNGQRFAESEVQSTTQAAVSIAIRDAILTIIPRAYTNPVYEQCKSIILGESRPLGNRRAEVMKRLMALGAVEKNVLDRLGRKDVTEVTAEDIATLIGLGTSVKEGDITIEDAFPETMVQPETPKQETIPAKTMPGRKPTQRGGKKNKKVEKPEPDPEAERQEAEDKMLAATQAKIDKEIADIESGNVFQSE